MTAACLAKDASKAMATVADLAWNGGIEAALREVDAAWDLLRQVRTALNRAKCSPKMRLPKQPKKAPRSVVATLQRRDTAMSRAVAETAVAATAVAPVATWDARAHAMLAKLEATAVA